MSVWMSEEVMRRCLRFCSRRSPWQQRSFLTTTSTKYKSVTSQQLAHTWGLRHTQSRLDSSLVSPVRFYSQDKIHIKDLEEKEPLYSPLAESSLPAEIQSDQTASMQIQRRSPFLDELESCGSPSDVLELTCKYAITVQQVRKCLNHMWYTSKKMPREKRSYELQLMIEHPAFDSLLQKAMKWTGKMRNEDMVYCLLNMVSLGVPQRSLVIQTFLRACQEKLNDCDDKVLSILAHSLDRMEDSSNVVALKEGMRLIVEARLPGIKNLMTLQTTMRLLGKDAPMDLKQKCEAKALSMKYQFRFHNTQHMIATMAAMGFYSKPLLDVCSKSLQETMKNHLVKRNNSDGISNRLQTTLQSCKELHYVDLDLLSAILDYVSSTIDIWTKRQMIIFLSEFEKLAFCPAVLIEAFAEKVIAKPEALTLKDVLFVLKTYSSLHYDLRLQRQQFLDSLSRALEPFLPNMSEFQLLKSVHHLCLLGHFPSAPLEHLLQSSTLEKFNATEPRFLYNQERMFRMVNLCLRLECPPLPQPLTVPTSVLGDPVSSSPPANPLLSQCLQSVLEDRADTVLQEMVVVEDYYIIDGVITKPRPNQTSETEASSCAESSQRIAVILAPRSDFSYRGDGTSNPCGTLAAKLRHLKILGYNPVTVTEQELQSVSTEERRHFLRGRIFPEHHRSDTQPKVEQLES